MTYWKRNERQKNIYVISKGEALIDSFNLTFEKVEEEIIKSLKEEEK